MLTFLKLGGSLITDKDIPYSPRRQVIKRIAIEVSTFLQNNPQYKIVIGHGSGSFGHAAAAPFDTIHGVNTSQEWLGFQEIWWAARQLNQIICEIFIEVGLPVISLPASAAVLTRNREVRTWCLSPLQNVLAQGLVPMVYGDVVLDSEIGGTILSTETLFSYLIPQLSPDRILLAGKDPGVFRDYPMNKDLLRSITPLSSLESGINLQHSEHQDVTGGMAAKVKEMLQIVTENPETKVQIFSGDEAGNIAKALAGDSIGTMITAE